MAVIVGFHCDVISSCGVPGRDLSKYLSNAQLSNNHYDQLL